MIHAREHLIRHIIEMSEQKLLPTDFIGYSRKELNEILAKLVLGLQVRLELRA